MKGKISLLLVIFAITISGCGNEVKTQSSASSSQEKGSSVSVKEDILSTFPLDEKGYPLKNIVIINGEQYPLDNIEEAILDAHLEKEIDIKLGDETGNMVEVILPQNNPICLWSIEAKAYIDLISYSKNTIKIDDKNMLEGTSANLQTFRFRVYEDDVSVSFKWSNVNEKEKFFNDKKENYLLKLKISK